MGMADIKERVIEENDSEVMVALKKPAQKRNVKVQEIRNLDSKTIKGQKKSSVTKVK